MPLSPCGYDDGRDAEFWDEVEAELGKLDEARQDRLLCGNSFTKDGERVAPDDVVEIDGVPHIVEWKVRDQGAEGSSVGHSTLIEWDGEPFTAVYKENLHPRDRLGRWIRSLGLPKVYEVGGAVRDELLGKEPKDIDFMAAATPEEIKAAVEAHGGVADPLTVRDRLVGVRAHMKGVTPPEGVEIAPPRVEQPVAPAITTTGIYEDPETDYTALEIGGLEHLPETVEFDGDTYRRTDWPHVSIVSPKALDAEPDVLRKLAGLTGEMTGEVHLGNQTYLAEKDTRRTLVVPVTVDDLPRLRAQAADLGIDMPDVPTHITTHVREGDSPIALRTPEEWDAHTTLIGSSDIVGARGRKDFQIVPHPDPANEEAVTSDAFRRDFTVNALYRDETGEVIDPTGQGVMDLDSGVLRTTHESSFRDDPLRILRGARFASQHNLTPDPQTFDQMVEHADAMTALTQKGTSGTVLTEMDKLLAGDHPEKGLRLLRDTGALGHLFPEIAPIVGYDQMSVYHDLTLDEHTFRVVQEVARQGGSPDARWAALLHDLGKPEVAFIRDEENPKRRFYAAPENDMTSHEDAGVEIARGLLNRINMPDARKRRILTLISEHMLREADKPTAVKARRLRARITDDATLADLFVHRRADMRSKGEDDDPIPTPEIDKLEELVAQAAQEGAPRTLADLRINGSDIVALGAQGPQVGAVLDDLLREVINQPNVNRHEWLLTRAAKLLRGA